MTKPARRKATYEDLLAAPEHAVAEIVAGTLYTSPRPAPRHANVSSILGGDLMNPYHRGRGGPGGWWILDEPELHLGEEVMVPDLGGWRRERMPRLPEEAYFTLAPDWVCEVLSKQTARLDRAEKIPAYARYGAGWAWVVDPDARTLELLRQERQHWLVLAVHSGEAKVRLQPFDAVEIDLAALWDVGAG